MTVHNVASKLGHSLRRWSVIDASLDKYLAQKKRNNFKMLLCHVIYSKPLIDLNNVGVYLHFVF